MSKLLVLVVWVYKSQQKQTQVTWLKLPSLIPYSNWGWGHDAKCFLSWKNLFCFSFFLSQFHSILQELKGLWSIKWNSLSSHFVHGRMQVSTAQLAFWTCSSVDFIHLFALDTSSLKSNDVIYSEWLSRRFSLWRDSKFTGTQDRITSFPCVLQKGLWFVWFYFHI